MQVRLTRIDGREVAKLNLPAAPDVIVWGKEKPRYFVRNGAADTYREAIVAFVNPEKGELVDA
jgi:hypothetical protein